VQSRESFFPAFFLGWNMADRRVLIVGLGNPGAEYEQTRHNAGFLALDFFAAQEGQEISTEKMQGRYCTFRFAGRQVFLLKPQTFMNRSGECVGAFARYFSVGCEDLLVLHDDLDLSPGRVKLVTGGGAGGHKGIRSLINQLGTAEFARIKIGIGHPRDNDETRAIPVERFVLSRFPADQWQLFLDNMPRIAEGIRLSITEGIEAAKNRVNRKPVNSAR